jgi:uncharacterized peroxidase-related enzyme
MSAKPAIAFYAPVIEENDASGAVAELYEKVKSTVGAPGVPHVFKAVSSEPAMLQALLTSFDAAFNQGTVPRDVKEIIATWIARLNKSPFLVSAHVMFFTRFGGSPDVADALTRATSVEELPLDEPTRRLVEFAEKITTSAHEVHEGDWAHLVDAGWRVDQVLEVSFLASMFNLATRLAAATGPGSSETKQLFTAASRRT